MSNIAERVATAWQGSANLSGITTASLLVVLLVSMIMGVLTGMLLGGTVSPMALAILAGSVGTVAAGIVRNTLLIRAWGAAGIVDPGTPVVVIVYSAVASLAGSLAAYQLAATIGNVPSVTMGMLASALSAALMGLLMVTYQMHPDWQLDVGRRAHKGSPN